MTSGESLAIIAAHPEPAYDPTHGLLSRRSTDRTPHRRGLTSGGRIDVSFRWVDNSDEYRL